MSKIQKQIILGFAIILLGVFFWYFLKYVFYIGNLSLACWVSGLVLLIFWGIVLCLAMLLLDDKRILYGSFIITLILFGMFFNNEPFYYFIGLVILLISFWNAARRIKKEEKIQMNLDFWRIWKRGLPGFITGLLLLVSLVYYFSPALMEMKQVEFKIPRNTFNLVIKPFEDLIKERLPGGMDLDTEAFKFLTSQQAQELEEKYGIKVEEGDIGRDVLYKLLSFQVRNATGPYRRFIPIGLAVALFITLKIISIIYVALVILLSWIILKILIALKFVKIVIEPKEIETIKL